MHSKSHSKTSLFVFNLFGSRFPGKGEGVAHILRRHAGAWESTASVALGSARTVNSKKQLAQHELLTEICLRIGVLGGWMNVFLNEQNKPMTIYVRLLSTRQGSHVSYFCTILYTTMTNVRLRFAVWPVHPRTASNIAACPEEIPKKAKTCGSTCKNTKECLNNDTLSKHDTRFMSVLRK